jgi:hypothetical protein
VFRKGSAERGHLGDPGALASGTAEAEVTWLSRIKSGSDSLKRLGDSIQIESQPSASSADLQGCKRAEALRVIVSDS